MPGIELISELTTAQIVGLWIQAALTLAILSFLLADNPVYKAAEHIFVGVSAGYGVVLAWRQAVLPLLVFKLAPGLSFGQEAAPDYWVLLPGLMGLLMLSRYLPKVDWLSRWPMAFVVGVTAGSSIPVVIQASLLDQMHGTLRPLGEVREAWLAGGGGELELWWQGVNAVLLVVGVICTLSYFYFSHEHRGLLGHTSRLGIWFLMVAFGAGFGNTVMARISLLIGRVQFMLYEWWPVAFRAILDIMGKV